MGRIRHALVLLLGVLSLVLATPALAEQSPVTADCNAHGQLTRHFSGAQLRTALNTMPPTVKEYTNCSDVINRALLAQVGSAGGGGSAGQGSGGSFLPVWLIVVIAVLILAGGGYALVAYRRQSGRPAAGHE